MKNTRATRWIAMLLVMAHLFALTACGGQSETPETTVPQETEAHVHAFVDGTCQCGQTNGLCVATFYLTANETVTKGTCLEPGMLSGGEEASLTFTYIDFKKVDAQKLEKLLANNPFPGVSAWTEGALVPAVGTQSAEGLSFVNTNPATDWWKVKLEQQLQGEKDSCYRVTFVFDSDAEGRIKFVNDGASYLTSNEFDVRKGTNTFTVDLKSGGNSYSCLELGGLGAFTLTFSAIFLQEVWAPEGWGR